MQDFVNSQSPRLAEAFTTGVALEWLLLGVNIPATSKTRNTVYSSDKYRHIDEHAHAHMAKGIWLH